MAQWFVDITEQELQRLPAATPPGRFVTLMPVVAAVVQTLAILVTGAWVYYVYATFQRQNNANTLKVGDAQLQQATLSRQQAELELRKTSIELGRLVQNPLAITHQLRVTAVGQRRKGQQRYFASYTYTFTNTANKPTEVSYLIADAFIARPGYALRKPIAINDDVTTTTPLRWEPLLTRAFNCRDWKAGVPLTFTDDAGRVVSMPAEHCGKGTGTAQSGETLQGQFGILLRGYPHDLIMFRLRCVINGATRTDISDYAPLVPETQR